MKIAFFTDTYLPNRDGVVTAMLNFRRELENKGHEVYVFSPGSRQAKKDNSDKRVFLYTSTTFKPYPDYKIALFPFFSSSKVKELGIDIIHSHGLATMGLAAYAASHSTNTPRVASFHTFVSEATHYISSIPAVKSITSKATWKYLNWYYNLYPTITAPSAFASSILSQHQITSQVLANGIDTDRFNPAVSGDSFRKKHAISGKTVFMHVGRVVLEKNIDLLIDSALIVREDIPDAVFVIVGTGPALKYYQARVREKGLSRFFVFTGFVPDAELPQAYAACDVFAFPSAFETQGLVALEAMACAKPVACLSDSAASELVEGYGCGVTFKNKASDCAEQLVRAAKESKTLSRKARARALDFSNELCAAKLIKLYESVLR